MTDMHNFTQDKNRAITELFEMNKRAFKNEEISSANPLSSEPNNAVPITNLRNGSFSSDQLLILGLFFILYKDCHDIWLFLALIYILL